MREHTTHNAAIPMASIIGLRVKSSVAADVRGQAAPRDHTITMTWGPNSEGQYVAWSANAAGGEHLRANSEDALIARVRSLM